MHWEWNKKFSFMSKWSPWRPNGGKMFSSVSHIALCDLVRHCMALYGVVWHCTLAYCTYGVIIRPFLAVIDPNSFGLVFPTYEKYWPQLYNGAHLSCAQCSVTKITLPCQTTRQKLLYENHHKQYEYRGNLCIPSIKWSLLNKKG